MSETIIYKTGRIFWFNLPFTLLCIFIWVLCLFGTNGEEFIWWRVIIIMILFLVIFTFVALKEISTTYVYEDRIVISYPLNPKLSNITIYFQDILESHWSSSPFSSVVTIKYINNKSLKKHVFDCPTYKAKDLVSLFKKSTIIY